MLDTAVSKMLYSKTHVWRNYSGRTSLSFDCCCYFGPLFESNGPSVDLQSTFTAPRAVWGERACVLCAAVCCVLCAAWCCVVLCAVWCFVLCGALCCVVLCAVWCCVLCGSLCCVVRCGVVLPTILSCHTSAPIAPIHHVTKYLYQSLSVTKYRRNTQFVPWKIQECRGSTHLKVLQQFQYVWHHLYLRQCSVEVLWMWKMSVI